jgi:hypothetical protein
MAQRNLSIYLNGEIQRKVIFSDTSFILANNTKHKQVQGPNLVKLLWVLLAVKTSFNSI